MYTLSAVYFGGEVVLHFTLGHSSLESFARYRTTFYVEGAATPWMQIQVHRNWQILS